MNDQISSEDQTESLLQKIPAYFPIFTLLAFGTCILNQVVYYYPFHLDIMAYTEINEILLDSLNSFLTVLFIYIVVFYITRMLSMFILYRLALKLRRSGVVERPDESFEFKLEVKTANRIMTILTLSLTSIFIILLIRLNNKRLESIKNTKDYNNLIQQLDKSAHSINQTIPQLDQLFLQDNSTYGTAFVGLIVFFVSIITFLLVTIYFRHFYETINFKTLKEKYVLLLLLIIGILSTTICNSLANSIDVRLYSTYGSFIDIGTKRITSNDNYYYIGRTKKFIFFYNPKSDRTDIYQNKDIALLSIKNVKFEDAKALIMDNKMSIINNLKMRIDSLKNTKK